MRVTLILSKGCKDWKRKRVGSAEFKRFLSMAMIHSNGRHKGLGILCQVSIRTPLEPSRLALLSAFSVCLGYNICSLLKCPSSDQPSTRLRTTDRRKLVSYTHTQCLGKDYGVTGWEIVVSIFFSITPM